MRVGLGCEPERAIAHTMWNSFHGYVIIRMEGFGLERILNRMLKDGIPVWNVHRESADSLIVEMRAKDFFRLRPLTRGMRCRVKIQRRQGMPFVLARFKCRKLLCAGACLVSALLVAASTRIWSIMVDGCDDVPVAVILRALEEEGAVVGMARNEVYPIPLGSAVRNYDDRIAWAGIQTDGIVLRVQVKEAELIPELPDKSVPSDIVAKKDGIIEKVTALNGKASVIEGDAVRAGDILIRGDITREGADGRMLVYAEGEASATVYYTAEYTKASYEKRLVRSGEYAEYRKLIVAGYTVIESEIPYQAYELEITDETVINGLVVPVKLITGTAFSLIETDVPVTREEQLAEAMYQAEYIALLQVPKDARILDKTAETEDCDDGSVRVNVQIRASESIGVTRAIEN